MGTILAIDPGNIQSGYVLVEHDGQEIRKVLDVGKVPNGEIFPVLCREYQHLAIEMVAGMGMPVGAEVFDTCFWIGRFWEYAELYRQGYQIQKIFRREEKLYLCGRASAKDVNIRQALVDRYAPGQPLLDPLELLGLLLVLARQGGDLVLPLLEAGGVGLALLADRLDEAGLELLVLGLEDLLHPAA